MWSIWSGRDMRVVNTFTQRRKLIAIAYN